MKTYKIFYYLYYRFNDRGRFITETLLIEAWGKEQAIKKFEDLGIDYDDYTIEEVIPVTYDK
jgi:hypothetical protein